MRLLFTPLSSPLFMPFRVLLLILSSSLKRETPVSIRLASAFFFFQAPFLTFMRVCLEYCCDFSNPTLSLPRSPTGHRFPLSFPDSSLCGGMVAALLLLALLRLPIPVRSAGRLGLLIAHPSHFSCGFSFFLPLVVVARSFIVAYPLPRDFQ